MILSWPADEVACWQIFDSYFPLPFDHWRMNALAPCTIAQANGAKVSLNDFMPPVEELPLPDLTPKQIRGLLMASLAGIAHVETK